MPLAQGQTRPYPLRPCLGLDALGKPWGVDYGIWENLMQCNLHLHCIRAFQHSKRQPPRLPLKDKAVLWLTSWLVATLNTWCSPCLTFSFAVPNGVLIQVDPLVGCLFTNNYQPFPFDLHAAKLTADHTHHTLTPAQLYALVVDTTGATE